MSKSLSASRYVVITPVADTVILRVKAWPLQQCNPSDSFQLLGQELPRKTGEVRPGPLRVLCTAPGEWLLICAGPDGIDREKGFYLDLQRQGLSEVEVSDGLLVLEIDGPASCDVLSKGCGLDFAIESFEPHTCASTRLAQIPVLIERTEAELRFRLYVGRSYAPYLCAWLADAGRELPESG